MIRFTLIAALFTIVIFQITGEKLPVNEGAMGDGLFFRDVAGNFLEDIEDGGYNLFQMQRLMPFAFVNVIFGALHILKSYDNLMRGMLILHFLFLGLGVYWYFSLATKLRLGDNLTVLGFVLIFANFAVLKDPWFNPFSTDLPTLMLAIGQANYFIKVNRQKLFLVSIIAGFVWPTMMLTGLLLIFLPSEPLVVYPKEGPKSFFPVLASLLILGIVLAVSILTGRFSGQDFWTTVLHIASVIILVLFVFAVMVRNQVDWPQSFELLKKKAKQQKIGRLVGVLFVYFIVIFLLSGSNINLDFGAIFMSLLQDTLRYPGDFLVGHMLFFGFLIPLTLAFFPRIIREAAKLGMGMMAVSLLMFVFVLHPESRLLLAFLPFIVVLLLKSARKYRIVNKDVIVISVLNVLLSAFWLPLNVVGMEDALGNKEFWSSFPAQRYLMHFGNMFSFEVYAVAAVVFIGLLVLAYRGKVRYKREEYVRGRSVAAKI
ncbi:hypothetical protein M3O96_15690 [Aquiflexum sp. TKW24L]|uniref:hypothetical protein n=1 Tax=Aquiflexum sp. TKW24L TaxID=2942212 RepID=UPI0020BEE612|nr:hypothetical protein [Aquiflexum sp. TKW24L]MCL6260545.1 hypothetical protein [Aquiflexum sp. TKW24L]